MIVTIDGLIATGKSTIAKKLAEQMGFIYYDTGAMYRCFTYGVLKHNIDIENEEELKKFLETFTFDIKIKHRDRFYIYENEDISDKIRLPEVTKHVSVVSAKKAVREKLVTLQRQLSVGVNAIFEGRDMGTVVFPHAELKIFLVGRPEIRAKRRFDELRTRFPEQTKDWTLDQALVDINRRDEYDSTREISPLRKADDALVVDTSDVSIDEIIYLILEYNDARKAKMRHNND